MRGWIIISPATIKNENFHARHGTAARDISENIC